MRKQHRSAVVGMSILLLFGGCTKPAGMETSTVKEIVTAAVEEKDFNGFSDSVFYLKYSVCSEAKKGLVDACLSRSSISDVSYDKEKSVYVVEISAPDPDSLLAVVTDNQEEIGTDLAKLRLKGAAEEEFTACVLQNAANLVLTRACSSKEKEVSVSYNPETGKIVSDADLCEILFASAEQEYPVDIVSASDKENIQDIPQTTGTVSQGGAFYCHYDGHAALVSNVQVQSGEEALNAVRSLSSINAEAQAEPGCMGYYITYCVTNLSRTDFVFTNAFTPVLGGNVVTNTGFAPVGLHDVESIAPSETKNISCYVVCGGDATLKWYSKSCDVYIDLILE